jgi:CTP synthase
MWDVDTIYKVPRMLHEQGLDGLICDKLRLNTPPTNLKRWDDLVYETEHPQGEVKIAMVGKYVELSDAYKSVNEALKHAGMRNHVRVKITHVDSETIHDADATKLLKDYDGILVPGGFGSRGVEGKISTARLPARTRCPTWASAWACRSPPSSTPAMWPAWQAPTPPSSIRPPPTP